MSLSRLPTARPKPFFRWAGSKRRILPAIVALAPQTYKKYIEVFAGSACLTFRLQPPSAIVNDINSDLIRAYCAIKEHPKEVFEYLKEIPTDKDTYYKIRSEIHTQDDSLLFTAQFLYLNRNCFNGLYRTNKLGQFNVPFSGKKTAKEFNYEEFAASAKSIAHLTFTNDDFESCVINNVERDDLVYLDPPYAVSNKRVFKQYHPNEFGMEDLQRLSKVLEEIENRKATFILSYADCKEARHLFRRWRLNRTMIIRNVAGFSQHRRRSAELLFSNT